MVICKTHPSYKEGKERAFFVKPLDMKGALAHGKEN